MGAFVELAVHASCQLRRERALHFSAAKRSGDACAIGAAIWIGGANAELDRFWSAGLAAALLEFPAIHGKAPHDGCDAVTTQVYNANVLSGGNMGNFSCQGR